MTRYLSGRGALAATALIIALCPADSPAGGGRRTKPESALFAGPNVPIYPSSVTQTEPLIARHPRDSRILFVAANTINPASGFISEGIYVSTDGGFSWSGSDTCTGEPVQFHRGDPGVAIDKDGTFILTRLGFSPGIYSHYSTDSGATWSGQLQVAGDDQDRASVTSAGNPSGPEYGSTYAAWIRFSPPFPVLFSRTTNGGASWAVPSVINNPSQRCQGADITTGDSGEVYVCWAVVTSTSPFTEVALGFASSTNGGSDWTVNESALGINGISGLLPEKANIRVNSLPRIDADRSGGARGGWIYIVTTMKGLPPAGSDPDIILFRSADGGSTWSSGIRVNQDPLDNGKIQYFPVVHVDAGGGVNVLYYSDTPTTSDSAAVYIARSTDGGSSWDEIEVGDHRFRPLPIGGLGAGYQGDNIALTSTGDTLRPVWMDNSSGLYQLWTSAVLTSSIVPVSADDPTLPGYGLDANYPNPFNPSTTISFSIARREFVLLTVHDIRGKLLSTLVDRELGAGTHEAFFSAGEYGLSSGIYLYRLTTPSYSASGKMLLLK